MKKLFFLILILTSSVNLSLSQNYNWITPNKNYLKLAVIEDAMYRITRTDFTNAGITTTSIDPRTVKVYNKGAEIPVYFQGESDGVFDAADYIDFFGTRTYGGIQKTYDVNNNVVYTKDEYYNYYSDTNVYWIGWDGANGLRLSDYNFSNPVPYGFNFSFEKLQFEKDKVYTQGERSGGNDFRNFNNELFQGEGWYWLNMYTNVTAQDTFSAPLLSPVAQNCTMKVFAYPADINTTQNNEHNLVVKVNGTIIANMYRNDFNRFDTTITFSSSLLSGTSVNTVSSQYFAVNYDGHLFFDFMQVQYPKIFKFRNNQLSSSLSTDTTSKQFKVTGYIPGNPLSLYDVKNNLRITNFTNSSDTLIFTGKSNGRYEIINKTLTKKPFRISVRQVPNLASNTNGADYLLVYNTLFEAQATQLKNHRESNDDFRVIKAEMKDIYDIFYYGLEDPVAVRNFTKYVYENYQLPKLKYLCLLGRGSLDPKKNAANTVYYKNFVPVIGNPTTDNYFGNFAIGAFAFVQQVAVGRLPAYTAPEAQIMVDNIIAYENNTPASWWKNFTFIVGGGTYEEQNSFQVLINPFVSNYINPPPVSGNAHKIYRTDYTTQVTYNYKDSIRRDIDNGAMIVNFLGHAGNENWEDGMQDPATLSNYGKLPLVLSMTCYTGKTADPVKRIFGEQFMSLANRGAMGFIGTSGWGWQYSGVTFQNWMLYGVAHDTLRRIGDIIKFGMSSILYDSNSSSVRHTINCYGLSGDPALELAMPKIPEFSITSSEYKLSNDFPVVNENVTITLYPKNFGLYADSVKIRFNLKKDNVTTSSRDTVLKAFKYSDSVSFSFKLDSLQNYSVQAILDNSNWYPYENKNNNSINVNIPLKNISFITVKPVDNSVLKTDSVEFVGVNPYVKQSLVNSKVIVEMDTTKSFNSPLKKTLVKTNFTGVVTKFKTSIPLLNPAVLYYWRTNAIINNDSSGWTKVQSFSYNVPAILQPEVSRYGYINSLADSNNILISKFKGNQFPQSDLNNTNFSGGLKLNEFALKLSVRSFGSSGAEISYFNVNDKGVNYDGGRSGGLNMMKVKKVNGSIIDLKNFKMFGASSSDSVVNFLNTFDSTYYLMALNCSYVDYNLVQPMSATAKAKIRTFGSTKIDSIFKFGYFDTWSFIGSLGAGPSDVSEQYFKYTVSLGWLESNSSLTRIYKKTYGTVSNIIGPSQGWNNFSWTQTLNPQSSVLFDVIGIDRNGSQTTLQTNLNTNALVDLSSVNSYQYPYLNLLSKISIDTVTGNLSSVMNSLNVNYIAPCELVSDKNSLKTSDTLLSAGNEFKFKFNIHNAGYSSIPGMIVNTYKVSSSPSNLIVSDTINSILRVDSMYVYYGKFIVPNYVTSSDNKMPVYVDVIPKGENNDINTYNNPVTFNLTLKRSSSLSKVEIISDGVLIKSGEIVRKKPEMKINVSVLNKEVLLKSGQDTSRLILLLNEKYIPYSMNGNLNDRFKFYENLLSDNNAESIMSYIFLPEFTEGTNRLSLILKNGSDNPDTVNYDFTVSNFLTVKDFYNFPNPMKTETDFVFNLLGDSNPLNSKIKIYTTAGRLIKEINFNAVIGFNRIFWDGKDDDGDAPANGTYLYKIVTEGESKSETGIQKLVILR